MKTAFFIDGFNFYHSLKDVRGPLAKRLRWFDYVSYCQHFMKSTDSLSDVYYFTALALWRSSDAVLRHKIFIDASNARGIKVVLGKFKVKNTPCPNKRRTLPVKCPGCSQVFDKHEEKATDVNIALHAYRFAAHNPSGQVIIVSGDTDMIPAVRMIKSDFPEVRVGVIFPFHRVSDELKMEVDFYHSTNQNVLIASQLPDTITTATGATLTRPLKWA